MQMLSYVLKSEQFADVDVVIRLAVHGEDSNNTAAGGPSVASMADGWDASKRVQPSAVWKRARVSWPERAGLSELSVFPGHRAILCRSDYFRAQDRFMNGAESVGCGRPILSVVVNDASHVPAVEAIIAVLYGVEGSIAELQQHQLLHVAQYADMLQLNSVAQQAVELLITAASTKEGLSDDALHILHHITWPDCLQPLLTALVQSVGSNLELMWDKEQLSKKLLELPLPAVRSLLSSDKLQVYSEDTVLYTAARYVIAQPYEHQAEACRQLSGLVRAPRLSDFQLTAQAVNEDPTAISVMSLHKPLLQKLLPLKRLGRVRGSDVAKLLPAAPWSWRLPARKILRAKSNGVKLLWQAAISELVSAYDCCRETNRDVELLSKSVTVPVSGIAFKLMLRCKWDVAGQGVRIGVYSKPTWCPGGVVYKQQFRIKGPGTTRRTTISSAKITPESSGWHDFFKIGTLQGPLEQSAWVNNGLPTTGSIELSLRVCKVL